MPTIKDGPMACSKTSMVAYTHELKNLRSACIRYLEEHEKAYPDQIWSEQDGEGRPATNDKDKARFKLVTKVPFKDGKPVFPPANTRLSDELVYLATKFLKLKDRARDYSYDFLPSGDINPGRVPSGVGPIVFAHGLPFFPVFKGYYILCGRQHVSWVGWMLHDKEFRLIKGYPIWTIGPVVAPGSAVALERTVERQLRVHKAMSMRDVAKGEEKAASTRDVVSSFHNHGSVVPKTSAGGFIIAPLYQVPGYIVHCGPKLDAADEVETVSRNFFKENRIEEFKYNDSVTRRYVNERNPRVLYSDEDDDDDDEEDSDESMATGKNEKAKGKRGLEEEADEEETELEGEGDDRAHKKIKTTIHLRVNAEEPDTPVTENAEAAEHTQTADKVADVVDQPMEDIDAKETTDAAPIQSTMDATTKAATETTTENETATEPATETTVQTTAEAITMTTTTMDVDTTETTAETTDETITETTAETATEAITVDTTTMDVDTTETKPITEPQHESPGIISTTDVETNTDPETCITRNTSEALEDAGDKMVEN